MNKIEGFDKITCIHHQNNENCVSLRFTHVHKTENDVEMSTMCPQPYGKIDFPHFKCVLWC